MKKNNIIKSVLFLACFSMANAQEIKVEDNAKSIVMTPTELDDFVTKIKELRKKRLLNNKRSNKKVNVVKIKKSNPTNKASFDVNSKTNEQLLKEINEKVNFLLYSNAKNSGTNPQYIPLNTPSKKDSEYDAYLKMLQIQKLEQLKTKLENQQVPPSYQSEFEALYNKISELEGKLDQTETETKTITITQNSKYDELINKYGNYEKKYFFGNNSSTVASSDYYSIYETAKIVTQEAPHIRVQLKGFASKSGSPAYNAKLSERRTKAIKDILVKKGVHPSSIEVLPLGVDNSAYSDAQARRVELNLLIIK